MLARGVVKAAAANGMRARLLNVRMASTEAAGIPAAELGAAGDVAVPSGAEEGSVHVVGGREYVVRRTAEGGEEGTLMMCETTWPGSSSTVDAGRQFFRKKGKKRKAPTRLRSALYRARDGSAISEQLVVPEGSAMQERSRHLRQQWLDLAASMKKREQRLKRKTRNTRKISTIAAEFALYSEHELAKGE